MAVAPIRATSIRISYMWAGWSGPLSDLIPIPKQHWIPRIRQSWQLVWPAHIFPAWSRAREKHWRALWATPIFCPCKSDVYELTTDLAFKYLNFSFEGGYYFRNIDPDEQTTYGEENAQGFYLQGGYFLIPKKLELAGRYAWVNPDNPNQVDDDEQQEYTGGLSYYIFGHDLKLQANYSCFINEAEDGDEDDHVVQGMVTLAF